MKSFITGRIAIILLGACVASQADMTMTQVRTTETLKDGKVDGKPKTETGIIWIAADKMRMDGEAESVLLKAAKDSLYMMDNKKKTYTAICLSQIAGAAQAKSAEMPPEMQAMMADMMKMEVTIEPVAETKTINGWKCDKYLQTIKIMGTTTTSELWATADVKVDPALMRNFLSSFYLKNQSLKDMAVQMQKAYEKINGFVVYSVSTSTVMGNQSRLTSEMREVKESVAPPGIYDVPAKYKMRQWE